MDKMTSNAKRDAAANKLFKDIHGFNPNFLSKECGIPLEITFFNNAWDVRDAEVAELRSQLDEWKANYEEVDNALDLQGKVLRRYTEENEALKQQVEEHNRKEVIFQKELTYLRSVIEECVSEMKKEIKTRDEAIEVAVKAVFHYSAAQQCPRCGFGIEEQTAKEALTKLNTLLGRDIV